jgi:hypothetical protein
MDSKQCLIFLSIDGYDDTINSTVATASLGEDRFGIEHTVYVRKKSGYLTGVDTESRSKAVSSQRGGELTVTLTVSHYVGPACLIDSTYDPREYCLVRRERCTSEADTAICV